MDQQYLTLLGSVAADGSVGVKQCMLFEKGDFDVQIELTGVNTNTPVNLPAACNKPISP